MNPLPPEFPSEITNFLTCHYAQFFAFISTVTPSNTIHVVKENSESNHPILKIFRGDNYLFSLANPKNPVFEAKHWVEQSSIDIGDNVICFGFGLGYHLRELLYKIGPTGHLNVIVLSRYLAKEALTTVDFRDILSSKNVTLLFGDVRSLVEQINQIQTEDIKIVYHDPSMESADEEYHSLISRVTQFRVKSSKQKLTGPLVWENYKQNLKWIEPSYGIASLGRCLSPHPVIIAAAGPSLDKNVHLLLRCKEKIPIFCVGTSLRRLISEGVFPDLVFSVDPHRNSLRHFEHLNYRGALAFLPSIFHEILNLHVGPKYVAFPEGDLFCNELEHRLHKGVVKTLGTVTFVALDVARQLGANPIIFIGLDLALTSGKTHCQMSSSFTNRSIEISVPSVDGGIVQTASTLNNFRLGFEQYISEHPECVFVDATEGGARIHGTIVSTLQDMLDRYEEESWVECKSFDKPVTHPLPVIPDWVDALMKKYG